MKCNKCGFNEEEFDGKFCPQCGQSTDNDVYEAEAVPENSHRQSQMPRKIDNNLVLAIITTLCCCLPFGIVSIVFAAQVDSKVAAGDIEGALDSSKKAKFWALLGMGIGFVCIVIYIIASVLLQIGMAASQQGGYY